MGRFTIPYFNLEKSARQGDPISAYLFILALEVLFELIKNNADIRKITIFNDTFCILPSRMIRVPNHLLLVKNLINTFKVFSLFSGLKVNFSKCDFARLGSLKKVLQAVCGLKSINLTINTIKILGVFFSYNQTIKVQNNFLDTIKNMQQVLHFWNSRMLSLKGRIFICKTLAISKIVYLTFLTVIPNSLMEELQEIQKTFI